MFQRFIACLLCVFLYLPSQLGYADSAPAAPTFTLPSYPSGQAISLQDYKGSVVYLDFWASWCKPCRTSFPWMNAMHDKYANQGLAVVTINLDSDNANIAKFLEAYPAQFSILQDPDSSIASKYKLIGMPSSYSIDRTGRLRARHTGFFIQQQTKYEAQIRALLNE